MFRSIGPMEISLILVIILIFFGVGKLPQVGSALGKGLRAFKKGQSGEGDNLEEDETTKPRRKQIARSKKVAKERS